MLRGQNTLRGHRAVGLERPHELLWARKRAQKWGRSSPIRCFVRAQIDRRAMRNLFCFGLFRKSEGDAKGDGWGDLCLSCTVHLGRENLGGCLEKLHENGDASGAMISRACREVAKHTPFLLSELRPRNAATEEELRNAREEMCPNLMPNNGPRAARISEWEKSGVDSSFISQRLILARNFKAKESQATLDIRHPSRICRTTHRQSSPTI